MLSSKTARKLTNSFLGNTERKLQQQILITLRIILKTLISLT